MGGNVAQEGNAILHEGPRPVDDKVSKVLVAAGAAHVATGAAHVPSGAHVAGTAAPAHEVRHCRARGSGQPLVSKPCKGQASQGEQHANDNAAVAARAPASSAVRHQVVVKVAAFARPTASMSDKHGIGLHAFGLLVGSSVSLGGVSGFHTMIAGVAFGRLLPIGTTLNPFVLA